MTIYFNKTITVETDGGISNYSHLIFITWCPIFYLHPKHIVLLSNHEHLYGTRKPYFMNFVLYDVINLTTVPLYQNSIKKVE